MPVSTKAPLKRQKNISRQSVFTRLLPACAFLLALCALVAVLHGNGYGSFPPAEQRYSKAKSELDSLRAGDVRAGQRENWLRLAKEFQEIYDLDPKWPNRPAVLFRKAESLRELARRSGGLRDYQCAAAAFEELAMRHAESRLADDALFIAAEIKVNFMGDAAGALRLLARIRTQYAQGDMLPRALELERKITIQVASKEAPLPKQAAQPPLRKKAGALTRIAWKTLSASKVQIVVELDRSVNWQARQMQAKNAAGPSSLILELQGAVPAEQIRSGTRITGSPLNAIRVDTSSKEQIRLFFDVTNLVGYETRVEQEPFRIILDVLGRESNAARQPDGVAEKVQGKYAQPASTASQPNAPVLAALAPKDLASQLALTVQTVFIDAGHGGKDPGTAHNGLVEREVTLDVARRVGRLLQNRGIDVQYSREKDAYIPLDDRTRMANRGKADLFVSIHVNASADAQACGFETFYLDVASNTSAARLATMENAGSNKKMGDLTAVLADFMLSARTQESRQLAQALQKTALLRLSKQHYSTRDGGVKAAPLYVLIGTGMPAVLVELGYCSNREEARRLSSTAYRQSLAEGIAEGILTYRDKLQRKQSVDGKAIVQPS
ncbi:MAG: N-acetylmuramoyl-L-alanine amidase [Betaproteobacteria bacterium]|nr:N-acetylmuramoyl-L-alanine amidase [Betaproteobacteria bacterium]